LNAADFENNAVFLQACRDLIDSMADSAKRRQSSGAALADNVRYYGHHLESLWNRMQVLAADPNLNNPVANLPAHLRGFAAAGGAANYNIVAAAVTGDTGRRLLAVPTMQLDFIAKAYHDMACKKFATILSTTSLSCARDCTRTGTISSAFSSRRGRERTTSA
jgi:hypothetical protein